MKSKIQSETQDSKTEALIHEIKAALTAKGAASADIADALIIYGTVIGARQRGALQMARDLYSLSLKYTEMAQCCVAKSKLC